MIRGQRENYYWIEFGEDAPELFLSDLWAGVPELIEGKYLVNTSYDSGELLLSDLDIQRGWMKQGKLAYSPQIQRSDIPNLPYEDYDEWYVFPHHPQVIEIQEAVINYMGFTLTDAVYAWIQEKLWAQMQQVHAEMYLGEGRNLICIANKKSLIDAIETWFSIHYQPSPQTQ